MTLAGQLRAPKRQIDGWPPFMHALDVWVFKSVQGGHHPPEHYGVLVVLPLLLAALGLSLRSSPRGRWRSKA
ncbi:hypothetical protein [Candidatus Binatus sp.]|uniref:hypothetical protein n=1 Tax=Candidatus Binatus sp. TaxID=2811406 RepID=UPI003BB0B2A8